MGARTFGNTHTQNTDRPRRLESTELLIGHAAEEP